MKLKILLLFVLVSCVKEPAVDSSTEDSFKTSLESIRENLDKSDREKFDDSLKVLMFSDLSLSDVMQGGGVEEIKSDGMNKLDGKTAKEIINDADKILQERKRKEREQALLEIKKLENKKKKAEEDKKALEEIKVSKSTFYKREEEFLGDSPVIELEIKNGTSHSLSRVHFKGTLASPGRKVPWLKKGFNYKVPGGVEPGESQQWALAPNRYSEWGRVEIKKDAVFTVEVVGADDHKMETLFSSENFSTRDQERLKSLKASYLGNEK